MGANKKYCENCSTLVGTSHENNSHAYLQTLLSLIVYVRLILFLFSLLGKAKSWIKVELPNYITLQVDFAHRLITMFVPLGKTTKLTNNILNFRQRKSEVLPQNGKILRYCCSVVSTIIEIRKFNIIIFFTFFTFSF